MISLAQNMFDQAERALRTLEGLQPVALLAARLYVAKVFLLSGLTKLRDWDTTLALFMDEYHVPVLPAELAAWLGTGAELLLPMLLVLGLGGRMAALGLFVLNAVAVLSLGGRRRGGAAAAHLLGQLADRLAAVGARPLVGRRLVRRPRARSALA